MKKIITLCFLLPALCKGQYVTQGICTQSANSFTLNAVSQSPYAGRFFNTTAINLNNNFDLVFSAYLGNQFNNGMAFLFVPGTQPTATNPALAINTDNIHNFGTGSISTDFVVEFDIRGSFCVSGQNTSYEPTTDVNHVAYWRNNSACTFGNYYSTYSALGTINYYAFEPYRIKWTKSTNTLETYYNNTLIKSNIVDLVGLLGTTVYWGFSSGCYCVTGGPIVNLLSVNGATVLPLTLNDFTADKNNGAVKLNWQTSQEQNTSHFAIERSNDGINFSLLKKVAASGNSNIIRNYSMTDANPFTGTNFYRIKSVDLDNKYSFSKTLAVKMEEKKSGIVVFPNPAHNTLQVQVPASVNEKATLSILDAAGKTLQQRSIQLNGQSLSAVQDISSLEPGVYQLVIKTAGKTETSKFIKQ